MRTLLVAAATCTVAGLLLSGPATAAPGTAQVALSDVMGGDQPPVKCAIPAIRAGATASVKAFHRAMAACADRFWSGRFAAAGLAYSSPEVTITTGEDSVCGKITSSGAHYCPEHRAIVIRVTKQDVRDPFRMNLAHSVAHEWGHHVQQLTGVLNAQSALFWHASEKARTLLSHRLEMQAECFAGVFYSATMDAIDPGISWEEWIDAVGQAEESSIHGKPKNLAFWQDRGYRGGATGFCNTWTAKKTRVT